jgi:hypothetical protein
MTIQSMVAVGFILLSICVALTMARQRVLGHFGWIIASALVALGGVVALWLAPSWAGWLSAALFVLFIAAPRTLLNRARRAAERGQWKRAAHLYGWASLLHPSPWTSFDVAFSRALSAGGTGAHTTALSHIEATGSPKQRALARLVLAQEQRDWQGMLALSRIGDVPFSEAKPREIRALAELGRLDEVVQTYQKAEKSLPIPVRRDCMLLVFMFTGRAKRVEQLLESPLSSIDGDTRTYCIAVARLRRNPNDEAACAMLEKLSATGTSVRIRRSAAQYLEQAETGVPPTLSEESERAVDTISPLSAPRIERFLQWQRQTRKARLTAALLLILITIIWAVLQARYGW